MTIQKDQNLDQQPISYANPSDLLEGASPDILANQIAELNSSGGVEELESDGEESHLLGSRNRSTSEGSKSRRRQIAWYKRPSPYWFYGGSLLLAIALAIVIPAKIEIYTQLVCRSLPSSVSNTTLPAPLYDTSNPSLTSPTLKFRNIEPNEEIGFKATEEEGDSWAKQCRRSKEVQKSVAKLATILSFIMGFLSVLTTGYWGSLSDRYGRTGIIALSLAGTIFLDAVFLATVRYHDVLGYNFLIVGPLLDGLLGGQATMTAATNAYLSDCSETGSRAWIFSINSALLFAGIAVGPSLGSLLINWTGSVMFVFYLALSMHIFYFIAIFFIPESLSKERQLDARKRFASQLVETEESEQIETESWKSHGQLTVLMLRLKRKTFKLFSFLSPLSLLVPQDRAKIDSDNISILQSKDVKHGKNWELTKIAISFASFSAVVAIMQCKILYAGYKYGYGPEENGYYLTFIGGVRVIFLLGFLPVAIKLFKSKPPLPSSPYTPSRPNEYDQEMKYLKVFTDAKFDLSLAKISVGIEVLGYFLLAANYTSQQWIFLLSSGISCFGSGGSPALQSLALNLTGPRDTGKIFASLGVITCVFAQILGPVVFGLIYYKSLGIYDESIFVVGELLFIVSLISLSLVKLGRLRDDQEGEIRYEDDRGRNLLRKGSSSPLSY